MSNNKEQWKEAEEMKILGAEQIKDCPKTISMKLLNEQWAQKNHGQTLKRLNERGGLSPTEALAIIEKREYKGIDETIAVKTLTAFQSLQEELNRQAGEYRNLESEMNAEHHRYEQTILDLEQTITDLQSQIEETKAEAKFVEETLRNERDAAMENFDDINKLSQQYWYENQDLKLQLEAQDSNVEILQSQLQQERQRRGMDFAKWLTKNYYQSKKGLWRQRGEWPSHDKNLKSMDELYKMFSESSPTNNTEGVCPDCNGSGIDSYPNYDTAYPTCHTCNGSGKTPKEKEHEA